ncbi:helix-hairpin-helix domain-containing protein [Streptomyces sp. NPDC050121]|uniref:helix-hairpin-helix domain-containing protein n=1 Tax=Streptomyces sp. NPDC050121 TaxID=3365601 RepID=UPI0037B0DB9A
MGEGGVSGGEGEGERHVVAADDDPHAYDRDRDVDGDRDVDRDRDADGDRDVGRGRGLGLGLGRGRGRGCDGDGDVDRGLGRGRTRGGRRLDSDPDPDPDFDPDAGPCSGSGLGVDEAREGVPPRAARVWQERAGPALRERMPVWLQTRCGLERKSVLALTVLLVAVAAFAVQHFWIGRVQPVRAPEVVRAAAPHEAGEQSPAAEPAASVGSVGSPGMASTASTAGTEIVVDVSGKVRKPGIHRLPAGSRVVDALGAAGGVRPGTNTDGLNRARFLVDGEQVVVGGPASAGAAGAGAGAGPGTAGAAGTGMGAGPSVPVSLNTATVDQLDSLPGVGPVLAQHIVDYRAQHGGFRSVDELREVNGIGERRFADLRNLVRP